VSGATEQGKKKKKEQESVEAGLLVDSEKSTTNMMHTHSVGT
jgi:hypothetical protein